MENRFIRRCLDCGAEADASTRVDNGKQIWPHVGDVSICAYCSALAIFIEHPLGSVEKFGMALRRPNPEEWVSLMADPQVLGALVALEKARERLARGDKN